MNNTAENNKTIDQKRDLHYCSKCKLPVDTSDENNLGERCVHALGRVYHLKCFTCFECGVNIADSFCPYEEPNSDPSSDIQIFCKDHYYKKMGLICEKCKKPVDERYVTGLGKKYHPQHFTCYVCTTEFGPDGTYYEHEGNAYCLYHYTFLVSSKCSGCAQPIMKLYLQIYSQGLEERWHPECYMIHKFWNVKICPQSPTVKENYLKATENGRLIREPQIYQIWTILSSFEESTAACISDMLLQVSNSLYIEGLRQAERFIMHVDVLFAAIDDLEDELAQFDDSTGLQHTREPKLLCKKIVSFFSVLSNTQNNTASAGLTQELLTLVTSLAHYLKVLIRVALKGGLKAEIEYEYENSTQRLLNKLSETSDKHKWSLFRLGYQETDVSSDLCAACSSTVETECIEHTEGRKRWHLDCFVCSKCNTDIQQVYPNCAFDSESSKAYCESCSKILGLSTGGFKFVSQLEQYSFLMRVALKRLYALLKYRSTVDLVGGKYNQINSSVNQTTSGNSYDNSNEYQNNADSTKTADRGYSRRSSLHEALAEVTAKRGKSGQGRTTKEDADYAFDVALRKFDDKVIPRKSKNKQYTAAEEAEAMGSKIKVMNQNIIPSQTYANASRRKTQVLIAPTHASQARMKNTQNGTLEAISHQFSFANQQAAHTNEKPKTIQRIKKGSADKTNETRFLPPQKQVHAKQAIVVQQADPKNRHPSPKQVPKLISQTQANNLNSSNPNAKTLNTTTTTGKSLCMSDLSPVELVFARFAATARLSGLLDPSGTAANGITSELLALVGITKKQSGSVWDKLRTNLKQAAVGRRLNDRDKDNKTSKMGTFGVPLDSLMERQGIETKLGTHGTKYLNIPEFFDSIISTLLGMDLTVEGIFRKNGNIRRLNEVIKLADKSHSLVNIKNENPVQVAALLKKFCRELPDPLIPFKMRKLFLNIEATITDPGTLLEALQCAVLLLPQPNRDMLNVLLTFLKSVASFSFVDDTTGSKMNVKNLAIVIAPNILYDDVKDPTKSDTFMYKSTNTIFYLIENTPTVWYTPNCIIDFIYNHVSDLIAVGSNKEGIAGSGLSTTSSPNSAAGGVGYSSMVISENSIIGAGVDISNVELNAEELFKRCEAAGLLSHRRPSKAVTNKDVANNNSSTVENSNGYVIGNTAGAPSSVEQLGHLRNYSGEQSGLKQADSSHQRNISGQLPNPGVNGDLYNKNGPVNLSARAQTDNGTLLSVATTPSIMIPEIGGNNNLMGNFGDMGGQKRIQRAPEVPPK
ncbi:hypothetical protein BB559_002654 [Furculomyces boomerangus]|uniref:Rho-GAP domain-containing protein n=1 Tax=Furculomyces boomerangus TaxID=61424 RepID=A0A2T9YBN4_9FUNG|nr:hypothetical protein BB559_004970 [Furculomyces boomerangus]PVU95688.1 hypothetical protein BB559_002654 [Furculomyces boomerangus]